MRRGRLGVVRARSCVRLVSGGSTGGRHGSQVGGIGVIEARGRAATLSLQGKAKQ